jgi:hypothetical protein
MLNIEYTCDDTGTERACWIQGAARVIHANQLGDEECQADADGGYESRWTALVHVLQAVVRKGEREAYLYVSP